MAKKKTAAVASEEQTLLPAEEIAIDRNGSEGGRNGSKALTYVGPDKELTRALSDLSAVSVVAGSILQRVVQADDETLKNMELTASSLGNAAWRVHVAVRHEAMNRVDAKADGDKVIREEGVKQLCRDFGGISWSTLYADARIQKNFFIPRADTDNEEDEADQIANVEAAAEILQDKTFFTIASNAPGGIDGKRAAVLEMAKRKISNNGIYTVAEARDLIKALKGDSGSQSRVVTEDEEDVKSSIEGNVSSLLAAIEQAYTNAKETNKNFYVWRNPETLNWLASETPNPVPPHNQITLQPTSAGVMPLLPGEEWNEAEDAAPLGETAPDFGEGGFIAPEEGGFPESIIEGDGPDVTDYVKAQAEAITPAGDGYANQTGEFDDFEFPEEDGEAE